MTRDRTNVSGSNTSSQSTQTKVREGGPTEEQARQIEVEEDADEVRRRVVEEAERNSRER